MWDLFKSIENKVRLGRPRDPPSDEANSECVDKKATETKHSHDEA